MILIRSQQNNLNTTLKDFITMTTDTGKNESTSTQWALTIWSISLAFNSVPLKEGLY